MSSQVTIAKTHKGRRALPALGFLLVVALSLIAYVIAPDVIEWIKDTFPRFDTRGILPQHLRLIFTAIVFVLLLAVIGMVMALTAPKKAINVNEADLVKERKQAELEKRRMKRRQRKINREVREIYEKK
jgi:type VI protein secretion system component VasK